MIILKLIRRDLPRTLRAATLINGLPSQHSHLCFLFSVVRLLVLHHSLALLEIGHDLNLINEV